MNSKIEKYNKVGLGQIMMKLFEMMLSKKEQLKAPNEIGL